MVTEFEYVEAVLRIHPFLYFQKDINTCVADDLYDEHTVSFSL